MRKAVRHPEATTRIDCYPRSKTLPPHKGWKPDYGWLVVLYRHDGTKKVESMPVGTTRQQARDEAASQLRASNTYEKAWIVEKTKP